MPARSKSEQEERDNPLQPGVSMWECPQSGASFVRKHPNAWMWCLHCYRIFQAKEMQDSNLSSDRFFRKDACKYYERCGGCGLGCDIYVLGDDLSSNPLPLDLASLKTGMRLDENGLHPAEEPRG
jgi:hypothetical protein